MSVKPIEYHIEIYEDSFLNDPVWSVEALTPFPAVSIGDRFEHQGLLNATWTRAPQENQEFRVIDIDHIFWDSGDKLGHKLRVKLELMDSTQEF